MPTEIVVNLKTNAIVNGILALTFILLSILFFVVEASLIPISAFGILMSFISLLLQYKGFNILSRICTSCSTLTISIYFYMLVVGDHGEPIVLIFAALTLVALFPWFLFAAQEIWFTIIAFFYNVMLILFCNDIRSAIVLGEGYPVIRNEVIENLLIIASLSVIAGVAYSKQITNRSEARKVAGLLNEINLEKQEALVKETKLKDMLAKLQEAQKEEEKRIWAANGLAETGKILREMNVEQKVTDRLISYLVKYLEVNQGAIFTISEESGSSYFTMRSCYAYDRKKDIEKKFSIDEGSLGQCYYEKSFIHLTQVPENYIHITSGLGYATPRSLLLVPMLVNDKVLGVMEFASFNFFESYQITFLMDVGENLAMALHTMATNEQTTRLLNETRLMAEEMRAQEEEMRQNMEELTATQEQQIRIEQELKLALMEKEKEILSLKSCSNTEQTYT